MDRFIKKLIDEKLITKEDVGWEQVKKHLNRALKEIKISRQNIKIDYLTAFQTAYSAMLHSGRALMLSYGLRPTVQQQHKTVVSFCGFVLDKSFRELVIKFDQMRKARHKAIYNDPEIFLTQTEVQASIEAARRLIDEIILVIKHSNPQKELF